MIIKSVTLEDFLSHKYTRVEFDRGVNVIIGPNGAGKTSIVDAIIFALFSDKVRGDSINDIIMKGSKRARVELEFVISNKVYKIVNERSKTKNDVRIYENGNILAIGKADVIKEVARILEMDKDIALKSIFVRQGEIASLLDEDPSKRKEFIIKLIGLDKLEYVYDKMRDVINRLEEETREYDKIKGIVEEKRKNLEDKVKKKEELEVGKNNKEKKLEESYKDLEEAKKNLEVLEEKKDKYNELNSSVSTINEKIKNIETRIGELKRELESAINADNEAKNIKKEVDRLELLKEYKEIVSNYERLKEDKDRLEGELEKVNELLKIIEDNKLGCEKYNELSNELEGLRVEEEKLRKDEIEYEKMITKIEDKEKEVRKIEENAKAIGIETLEDKDKKLKELNSELDKLSNILEKLKEEKGSLNGKMGEVNEHLSILGENRVCPICKQELTEEHREAVRKDFEEELSYIKKRLNEIRDGIYKNEDMKKKLEEKIKEVENVDIKRLIELKEELDNLKSKKEELSGSINRLNWVRKRIKEVECELDKLKVYYDEYIGAIKALKSHKSIKEIESELNSIYNEIKKVEKEKIDLESSLEEIPEDLDGEIKRFEKLKEEYIKLKEKASKIDELNKTLVEKRRELEETNKERDNIIRELNSLGYSKEEYDKIKRRKEELDRIVTSLETELNNVDLQIRRLEDEIRRLNDEIRELVDKLSKLERVQMLVNNLKKIREAFSKDGIQKVIRKRITPLISEAASNYLDEFNLGLTSLSINEDFDITLMRGGEELHLKSISGGEKVAVAIALRLAIANAISSRLSAIIMDEPTVYLDEERRRELVDIMKNFSTNSIIPQLIIITHNRELEDVGDIVYNVAKENGISTVKTIEF